MLIFVQNKHFFQISQQTMIPSFMVCWYFIWNFSSEFFHGSFHLYIANDMVYPACIKNVVSYLGISFPIESNFGRRK